jgi:hypothetical protein
MSLSKEELHKLKCAFVQRKTLYQDVHSSADTLPQHTRTCEKLDSRITQQQNTEADQMRVKHKTDS